MHWKVKGSKTSLLSNSEQTQFWGTSKTKNSKTAWNIVNCKVCFWKWSILRKFLVNEIVETSFDCYNYINNISIIFLEKKRCFRFYAFFYVLLVCELNYHSLFVIRSTTCIILCNFADDTKVIALYLFSYYFVSTSL